MAWSARKKKNTDEEERASGNGADWIHQTSIDEGIEELRKALKDDSVNQYNGDWVVVKLCHIAVMRGQTRKVAPLVVRLLERRDADNKLKWNLDRSSMPALGISLVRLMAAYLEDPAIPTSKARAGVELFMRSIADCAELNTVRQLMPMIMAVRTDEAPTDITFSKRRSGLPLKTDMDSSGMCAATHRQWRVEYLLAMGSEDEALELAHRGRSEKPCGGTCAFAPHSMYGWLLAPLHRRGRKDESHILNDRLGTLLTSRLLYLDAMGCRIHFLALEERFQEANTILRAMLPLARDSQASPWQQLKFYDGCARALDLAKTAEQKAQLLSIHDAEPPAVESEILTQRDSLRAAYAARPA